MDDGEFTVRIPAGTRDFSVLRTNRTYFGAHRTLYSGLPETSLGRGRGWAWGESDHPTASTAEFM